MKRIAFVNLLQEHKNSESNTLLICFSNFGLCAVVESYQTDAMVEVTSH